MKNHDSSNLHGRIHSLDGLRGFLALVVVVHHYSLITLENADMNFLESYWYLLEILKFFAFFGQSCVWFFFILSGYSLSLYFFNRYDGNYLKYLSSRMTRLYFPIESALALTFLSMLLVPRDSTGLGSWVSGHPAEISLNAFTKDLSLIFGTSANLSPLWSMQWEVIASVIFPLIYLSSRYIYLKSGILLIASTITLCCFAGMFELGYLAMFFLGAAIQNLHKTDKYLWNILVQGGPIFALLLVVSPFVYSSSNRYIHFVFLIYFPVIGMSLLLENCIRESFLNRLMSGSLLRKLGKISFSLYLTHEIVLLAFTYYFDGNSTYNFLALLLTVPVAVPFYFAVESRSHRLASKFLNSRIHKN